MPETTNKHRIDEELVCAESLRHVLLSTCSCTHVQIHREAHDPPDFTVTIDGAKFPTEVTSIVSRQQHHAQLRDFVSQIHKCADAQGVLCGHYIVTASRYPVIPKPTSSEGRELLSAAEAYIDASKQAEHFPELLLSSDSSGKLEIAKVSGNINMVGACWFPPLMWEGDTQTEMISLIQRAVDDKIRKLTRVGFVSGQVLLLLYDAFAFGEPDDALAAFHKVTGFDYFHSAFWAASFSDRANELYPTDAAAQSEPSSPRQNAYAACCS